MLKLKIAAVALFAVCAQMSLCEVSVTSWTPAFKGVEMAKGSIDGTHPSVFYAAKVDLKKGGVSLYSTPQAGPKDTISDTTSHFLLKNHVQVAINTGFFDPCCVAKEEPKDIEGIAISQGHVVSQPSSTTSYDVALVMSHGKAEIRHVSPTEDLSAIDTAVAGSAIIVSDGKNNGTVNLLHGADKSNPRTVIGLSRDGRYLYLVVIDGRKQGYSIGTTNTESADILIKLGAYTALNVDGGGSTAMMMDDGKQGFSPVNRPSGGTERWDAIQLGVRAEPLK